MIVANSPAEPASGAADVPTRPEERRQHAADTRRKCSGGRGYAWNTSSAALLRANIFQPEATCWQGAQREKCRREVAHL